MTRLVPCATGMLCALLLTAWLTPVAHAQRASGDAAADAADAQETHASKAAAALTPREIDALLDGWQLREAASHIERLQAREPRSPSTLYLRARQAFFMGQYEQATSLLDEAIKAGGAHAYWSELRQIMHDTHQVTRTYEKHTTPKGYFEIFIEPGRDRLLLPYAFEVLDQAYEQIGAELEHKPPTPIRVEIYPTTATLAKVSSLTEDEIKTSGTIALCKYNRLMITSPKALLRGYTWADTLAHEYVHYVINHKTQAQVPIWMHEGMAKFLERRWRGPQQQMLPPSSEHLLRQRLERGKLITFEQMHPSMAKLPSQEDAAVAFAQVYTVMEYLHARLGPGGLARVLDQINQGKDARAAYAAALGTTFAEFEPAWIAYMRQRPKIEYPDEQLYEDKLRFKEDAKAEGQALKVSDLEQIPKPAARDHVKLGELMQARERYDAAIIQYHKAIRLMGDRHPVVQTRLAQSHLARGQAKEAMAALTPIRQSYPSYVGVWLRLGQAALILGEPLQARDYLLEAAYINPFDPEVHELLERAYKALGQEDRAAQEAKLLLMAR